MFLCSLPFVSESQSICVFLPFSSFLFDFSPFFPFFSLQKHTKSTQMTDKKDMKAQCVDKLEVLVGQGDTDAKRELAIRLMEGNGVPQNHTKAVVLLEDCAALDDAEAMLILAKCCAFGHGIEYDAERAESLICEAANKGNEEALCLMKLINKWKWEERIDLRGLSGSHRKKLFSKFMFIFVTGRIEDELTTERVCLLMNIVPCKEIYLARQSC